MENAPGGQRAQVSFAVLPIYLAAGYFIAWLGFLTPLVALFLTGQLIYMVLKDQAAIVKVRGRIWEIHQPGWQRLSPFQHYLISVISTKPKEFHALCRNFATMDGVRLTVSSTARYVITDAYRVWSIVEPTIQPQKSWGIPHPVPPTQITEPVDRFVGGLVNEVVKRVAQDSLHCQMFGQLEPAAGKSKEEKVKRESIENKNAELKVELEKYMQKQLSEQANLYGLQIDLLELGIQRHP
ncbi:MAG: hypothetical protein HY868_05960 [Chloroflexi bacterium]|nr:hypothetical protein [Chloroflexota bacterium]